MLLKAFGDLESGGPGSRSLLILRICFDYNDFLKTSAADF